MRRGTEPSGPALASTSTNTGSRGQPASRGKRSVDERSARPPRVVIEHQPPSQNLNTPQTTPWRPKSPSYLTGKNPYGRILDDVEHPYRKPRAPPGPPSQLGSNMGGRPRTSGSFRFTTRPTPPPAPERKVSVDGPPTPPPLPPRRPPQKKFSVQDAKSFFEKKAAESRKELPLQPTGAVIANVASADSKLKRQPPQVVSRMRIADRNAVSRPAKESPTRRKASSPSLYPQRPPVEAAERRQSAQRTNPFPRATAVNTRPNVVVRTTTGVDRGERPVRRRNSPGRSTEVAEQSNSESVYAAETSVSARRRSTNVFTEPKKQAQSLSDVQRSVVQRNRLDDLSEGVRSAMTNSSKTEQPTASDETVRRRSTWKSSNAEIDEVRPSSDLKRTAKAQHPQTGYAVRRFAGQPEFGTASGDQRKGSRQDSTIGQQTRRTSTRRTRRQKSRSVPIDQESDANESVRQSRRRSMMSEPRDLDSNIETYVRNFGEPIQTAEKLEEIAAKSLSHDGSSSHQSFVRRTSAQPSNPTANVAVEEDYYSIEVPDHVDWRGGYGRRKTQDFGFPGARIKPRSTFRTYKAPLQDPGNWIKRACGHFSTISAIEPREEAAKKPCSQCHHTAPSPPIPLKHHRARRRAATDSSTSSSCSSRKPKRCRRQHHSECIPGDKCGDTFAQDLGYIIDSILEEHQNTLQSVISNIKHSQPNLAQLRRVSEDLLKRCKSRSSCTGACHSTCQRPVYNHVCQPCQPSQPVCQPYQPCQPCQPCQPVPPAQQVCD